MAYNAVRCIMAWLKHVAISIVVSFLARESFIKNQPLSPPKIVFLKSCCRTALILWMMVFGFGSLSLAYLLYYEPCLDVRSIYLCEFSCKRGSFSLPGMRPRTHAP